MSEFLVQLSNSPLSGDPGLDCLRYNRGDVIVAVPDDWPWSPAERDNPDWLIVRVPGMGDAEAQMWVAGEPDDGTQKRYRWLRLFHLELPADVPETRDREFLTLTLAQVRGRRRRKEPHPDPDLIG